MWQSLGHFAPLFFVGVPPPPKIKNEEVKRAISTFICSYEVETVGKGLEENTEVENPQGSHKMF